MKISDFRVQRQRAKSMQKCQFLHENQFEFDTHQKEECFTFHMVMSHFCGRKKMLNFIEPHSAIFVNFAG